MQREYGLKMMDDKSELFVVVDEEDNIISYRTRYDCHHDKHLIHRAVDVVIMNDKGEILLQKRSKHKDTDTGKYDVAVSGHVGKGESYEACAQREMMEEIGVLVELAFVKKMLVRFPEETEYDAIFQATHNGPFKINKDEIDEITFVAKDDIKDNMFNLTMFARKALEAVGIL